jgi:TatD DNase family protein
MNDRPFLFDIHSHLNDAAFDSDREEVIARIREKNVFTITVGTGADMSQKACDIARNEQGFFASIAQHPSDNTKEIFDREFYIKLAKENSKVVSIGECGLDYFRLLPENEINEKVRQKKLFEDHIDLAVSLNKPMMIHCRDAHKDILDILKDKKKEYGDSLRGDIHFFADTVETAKQYFDLDFTVSFTGVITFARNYDEVIKYAPLSRIMSETDAPYVAPIPYRGKRCEPIYVEEVVKKLAEIRGEDLEMVQKAMVDNAFRIFNLEKF